MDFVTTVTTAAGQGKVRIVIDLADRERCSPERCGRCREKVTSSGGIEGVAMPGQRVRGFNFPPATEALPEV